MCGIVGYIGDRPAQPILFQALTKLEYRGYDSSGIAIRGSGITVQKDRARVTELEYSSKPLKGTTGIGHTRWATHGVPSALNSHPHLDCTGKIALVHNGVVTNYLDLRDRLINGGHRFVSETDSEVIVHLIEENYAGNLEDSVGLALEEIEGSYAIAVVTEDERKIVVARKDNPLVIGVGDHEFYVGSDATAILPFTNTVIFPENGDIAVLTNGEIVIRNGGYLVERVRQTLGWQAEDLGKSGFDHFMLKEIYEQPKVIYKTLAANDFSRLWPSLSEPESLLIVACGSSYNAGCVAEHVFENLLGLPVHVVLASEINYRVRYPIPREALFITQSGETADILRAMERLKKAGSRCLVLTNVKNSSAARLGDDVYYTDAGPEVSVAATKSFIGQLTVLYQMAEHLMPKVCTAGCRSLSEEFSSLPDKIQTILDRQDAIKTCAYRLAEAENVYFLGKGLSLPIAQEGALKLKEISYIHAEACAAGELKHGSLALIYPGTPVIAVTTPDGTRPALLTSIKEVKARDAYVISLSEINNQDIIGQSDEILFVPETHPILTPVLNTVVLQLLAYHTAVKRGCPIDFPKNLAKSVTVE